MTATQTAGGCETTHYISSCMKIKLASIILLIGLCTSISVPSVVQMRQGGDTPVLVTLDVCHSAGFGVLSASEMPFLHEQTGPASHNNFAVSFNFSSLIPDRLLLSEEKNHPPRV